MNTGEVFQAFCSNIAIPTTTRSEISSRYKEITNRLNKDFYGYASEIAHSLYVGSYGRETAIRGFSDLDMLFILPSDLYRQYDNYSGNGQSALLQKVRNSIQSRYSSTKIGADGQVVVVTFSDGIQFEVVPCFEQTDGSFTYADTNRGGRWKKTDPRPEIAAVRDMDRQCNGNLKPLCRMTRAWKNTWNVPIGGLLIDTLAYKFIENWKYREHSYYLYDWMCRDFFLFLSKEDPEKQYWYAIGSNQLIYRKGHFERKAKQCYNLACEAIQKKDTEWTAKQLWRKIYGAAFPN